MSMRLKSYLGLKFNFSQSSNLELKNTDKNVSLSFPPPPPPFSLVVLISLIDKFLFYFYSHIKNSICKNTIIYNFYKTIYYLHPFCKYKIDADKIYKLKGGENMKYEKPEIVAQNSSNGSFAAGCPEKDTVGPSSCKKCERTS